MQSDQNHKELPGHETAIVPQHAGALGKVIDKLSVVFAFGFVLSMCVLIFEIFMRHVLNAPTLWAHETTTFLCAVGFVFGGLYSAVHNKHIRVVPLYDNVSARVRHWLDIIIYLACAVSSGFFSYAAWLMVQRSIFTPTGDFRLETSGSAWNPPTPALLKLFLLLILCVLTVQFLILALSHLKSGPAEEQAND